MEQMDQNNYDDFLILRAKYYNLNNVENKTTVNLGYSNHYIIYELSVMVFG